MYTPVRNQYSSCLWGLNMWEIIVYNYALPSKVLWWWCQVVYHGNVVQLLTQNWTCIVVLWYCDNLEVPCVEQIGYFMKFEHVTLTLCRWEKTDSNSDSCQHLELWLLDLRLVVCRSSPVTWISHSKTKLSHTKSTWNANLRTCS